MRRSTWTLNFEHNAHPKLGMTTGAKNNVVWQNGQRRSPLGSETDLRSIRNDATAGCARCRLVWRVGVPADDREHDEKSDDIGDRNGPALADPASHRLRF